MDELLEKLPAVLRDNLLAFSLAILGFGLLLYGLIAFLHVGEKPQTVSFSAEDNKRDQPENTEAEAMLVVDVAGAVAKPGVYKIKDGSRFQDAILAAGGLSPKADSDLIAKQINLAAKLTDSAKVYVPFKGEVIKVATGVGTSGDLININTATAKELDSLSGIGNVTSEKIINARPFAATDDLVKKKIVSQKVFDQIKEKVSVF